MLLQSSSAKRKQQRWWRYPSIFYAAVILIVIQVVHRLVPPSSATSQPNKDDALSVIRYDEHLDSFGLKLNQKSHGINILTCEGNTSIANRVFYPTQFMENPHFKVFKQDLDRNNHLVKNNYIIFGDRSSKFSVYFHIHKCGGTTMEYMSTKLKKEDLNWKTEQEIGSSAFDNKVLELLDDVDVKGMIIFSFCRDPLLRFLSSLGQLLSMPQRHHKLAPCHLHRKSATKLVSCVLDKITERGDYRNYLDPHFMPQAYELYSSVKGKSDIGIQLFALSSLDDLQRSCSIHEGSSNPTRYRIAQHVDGFPKLTARSLTPQLIDRICQVYVMDVLFLQSLGGLENTLCRSG